MKYLPEIMTKDQDDSEVFSDASPSCLYNTDLQYASNLPQRISGLRIQIPVPYFQDLTYFHRLQIVDVSGSSITNVEPLRNALSVGLSGCAGITDISALCGVPHVDISFCVNVVDVSWLAWARSVDMEGCTGVFDIIWLGYVQRLNVVGCTGIIRWLPKNHRVETLRSDFDEEFDLLDQLAECEDFLQQKFIAD
eukprot:c3320_g1_i1.p1 GENE.c3320_g1_i1~~c3320_g1_i1.p1  ORF type:complete len:194 (-),score=17.25 c3320_g1_i1:1059-1640(-)